MLRCRDDLNFINEGIKGMIHDTIKLHFANVSYMNEYFHILWFFGPASVVIRVGW